VKLKDGSNELVDKFGKPPLNEYKPIPFLISIEPIVSRADLNPAKEL
jgi:hypothetical protein